jgi:hypothetical protein
MDIAVGVLTAALVLVTAYYAYQTHETVQELRRARAASIMPKPAMNFDYVGGPVFFVVLANTGTGPALEVDLTMSYEPEGPRIPWKSPLMSVGERVRFLGPEGIHHMTELIDKYERVVLTGSCLDALGGTCDVNQTLVLREHWESGVEAKRLLDESDSVKMTRELEKIRREIEGIRGWAEWARNQRE